MPSVEQHISELLFDHDCVIVPSLGGFLATNQQAFISGGNQIFPPYRRIAFNVYLKQNDGLLANHLVEFEHVTYQEALARISTFVNTCLSEMNDGKKVILKNIGTLYFDREHNLQFEAARNSNHLKDTFGMEVMNAIPVRRDEEIVLPKVPAIKKEIRPSQPAPKKVLRKSLKKNHRPLGIVAITAAALWFSFNIYLITPKKYDSASLSPFDSQSITLKTKPAEQKTMPPARIDTVYVSTAPAKDTDVASAVQTPSPKVDTPVTTPTVVQPENQNPLPVTPDNNADLYVIAGVFSIHDNALSLIKTLRLEGFEDAGFTEANGKTYVYYRAFSDRSDAVAFNDSLRDKNHEGWIWKKK